MKKPNPIKAYRRLIVSLALIVAIVWPLAGTDWPLLGTNTRFIISGVCGAGLLVFLIFYKEEDTLKPTTSTIFPLQPAPLPPEQKTVKQEARVSKYDDRLDVSKIIDEAHAYVRTKDEDEDIFSGFE